MTKRALLLLTGLALTSISFAQFNVSNLSVGVSGNYTMYKGDFQRSTPGARGEVHYGMRQRVGFSFAYTKGLPIKVASTMNLWDGVSQSKTVPATTSINFNTYSISAFYNFIGNEESAVSFYGDFGASYVKANMHEKADQAFPAGYSEYMPEAGGNENGILANLGLGLGYYLGTVQVFAEGGIALPAQGSDGSDISGYIPSHLTMNAGIRIPLFRNGDY